MELEQQLRDYVVGELMPGEDPDRFDLDEDLIDSGILDSLAMVNLVAHLEQTHGIQIKTEDMIPENFGTVRLLAAFVQRKRSGASRA